MDYSSAIEWLYGTQLFGIKLGLENVHRLCDEAGLPAGQGRIVHVAGSNGKGSVCAFADAMCRAGGQRTGLFTSPHLVTYRERIAIDGEWIGEEEVATVLTELRDATTGWDPHPTFFELSAVLAMKHFLERAVEIIVLETGMGGRLDATTALAGRHFEAGGKGVSVITPIAFDHQQWLGDSLAEIAAEKAGIIFPGVSVVSAPQAPEAEKVLRAVAERGSSPLRFVEESWEEGPIGLEGSHQKCNAALAAGALESAAISLPGEALREGVANVRWRGRFDRITGKNGAEIVLDGAHNPEAVRALVKTWREVFGISKATVVFGTVVSKDYREMLRLLEPVAEDFVFCAVNSMRGVAPDDLAGATSGGVERAVIPRIGDALAASEERAKRILVTGSLFLVGEALAELGEGEFEKSLQ